MTDDAGAAPAATDPAPSPRGDAGSEAQSDLEIGRWKETARHSLDRAFAALEQEDAGAAVADGGAAQPAAGQRRNEQGRFKAKEATPENPAGTDGEASEKSAADTRPSVAMMEPPARFSADAKTAWKDVPDSVKGEVGRAFRELETGLSRYQQAFEPLKPYFQMAHQRGVAIHEALDNYVALDKALVSEEPAERLAAIEHLLSCAGITPQEYAGFIMNQPADRTQGDQTIRTLRQELADVRNQLGGVTRSMQQRQEEEVVRQVEEFAMRNPRLNEPEFQSTILRLLQTRMADTLQSAYDMAERLNPAPASSALSAAPVAANSKAGPAQTRNGNLTITGGPGSGSNPARRKAPSTARESVDSAFASLGLG